MAASSNNSGASLGTVPTPSPAASKARAKRSSSNQTVLNPAAVNLGFSTLPAGGSTAATAVADFNRDGVADLVVTLSNSAVSNNIAVFLGSGNGSFGSAISLASGGLNPLSVVTGDFNGDGNPDLVTANLGSDTVSLLAGNGTGGFGQAQTFRVGSQPSAIATADFNRDGRLDLVMANSAFNANSLSVLLGEAGGFRTAKTLAVSGSQPVAVAVGDFDRDGNPDLVSTDVSTGSISLFLGRGNGDFRSPSQFFVGGGRPVTLVAGDFDEDNKLDLAVGSLGSNTQNLTLLFGDGKGDFSRAALLPVTSGINSLVTADFNGDSHLDLATLSQEAAVLAVYNGNGEGNFSRSGSTGVNSSALGLSTADFNQDGKTDLASTSGSNAAILLNRTSQVLLRSSKTLSEVDGRQETDSSLRADLKQGSLTINSSPTVRVSVRGFQNVLGTQRSDQITGSNRKNQLSGLKGADALSGLDGDDLLTGGVGADRLTGGDGRDRFLFDHGAAFSTSQGVDRITDFDKGRDRLVLDRGTFTALKTSQLGSQFATVSSLQQAQTSSALITYIRSTGRLYYNANGANAGFGSGGLVANLGSVNLAASDFLIQT
ncbi:MAG: FG-GAP-like repeat-containing protein [Elainella sp.]